MSLKKKSEVFRRSMINKISEGGELMLRFNFCATVGMVGSMILQFFK